MHRGVVSFHTISTATPGTNTAKLFSIWASPLTNPFLVHRPLERRKHGRWKSNSRKYTNESGRSRQKETIHRGTNMLPRRLAHSNEYIVKYVCLVLTYVTRRITTDWRSTQFVFVAEHTNAEERATLRTQIEKYMNRAEQVKKHVETEKSQNTYHEQILIEKDSTGHSYSKIFKRFLDETVCEVEIDDPYIRAFHQVSVYRYETLGEGSGKLGLVLFVIGFCSVRICWDFANCWLRSAGILSASRWPRSRITKISETGWFSCRTRWSIGTGLS